VAIDGFAGEECGGRSGDGDQCETFRAYLSQLGLLVIHNTPRFAIDQLFWGTCHRTILAPEG
jgi:hypothetical protein